MTINLYKIKDDKNRLTKNLPDTYTTLTGNVRDAVDLLDPVILVNSGTTVYDFNYMYIPDFKRYYFITGITGINSGITQIQGHVDVLMSFKSEILKCEAIIARQENVFNWYLTDPMINLKANPIVSRQLPDNWVAENKYAFKGAGRSEFVLTVLGGHGS